MEPVLTHPDRGQVPDQQDSLMVTLRSKLRQKLVHALGDLPIAFSVGKRRVKRGGTRGFYLCPPTSREVAIIALAQQSILDNRYGRTLEDEGGSLIGALGV